MSAFPWRQQLAIVQRLPAFVRPIAVRSMLKGAGVTDDDAIVLAGVVLALRFTGTTLNLQSFMGAIMATGIAIANSILLVTFAELARRSGGTLADAAAARLRAVLMTAFAMMAGMTPMALGAAQTAPLGRAVLGGLALATVATLTVVPLFYNILQPQNARDASLLPHEENS